MERRSRGAPVAAGEPVEEAHRVLFFSFYDTADFIPLHTSPYLNVPGLVDHRPQRRQAGPGRGDDVQAALCRTARPCAEKPEIRVLEDLEPEDGIRTITASAAKEMRLDAYLAKAIPDISRARVTLLIDNGQVTVNAEPAKGKQKLKGGELIEIEGDPQPEPLHAAPEDIPLDIVFEDDDLAVVNKPSGMMVHRRRQHRHNRGTLVNALLFHLGQLSQVGGDLRPGIVHRLDKQTSGLIVVAKNDSTHRKLSEMFSSRGLRKIYIALVHGEVEKDEGTISLPISRDIIRRTRMTTRRMGGRTAVSHYRVLDRIDGPLRQVHPRRSPHRNRPHSPDPRPHAVPRTPWSSATISIAHLIPSCLWTRASTPIPSSWNATSARRPARIPPSPHQTTPGAEVRPASRTRHNIASFERPGRLDRACRACKLIR